MNITRTQKGIAAVLLAAGATAFLWFNGYLTGPELPDTFASGNGRLESTEVDVATKLPGRVSEVLVQEGEMVTKGQQLANLDDRELAARLKQAQAQHEQAKQQLRYAEAIVAQRESERDLALKNLERSKSLYVNKNISLVQLQQHETALASAEAVISAAKAQVVSAKAAIEAAAAQVETIKTNLDDCNLYAPIAGRVLYRLVEPGEVVGSGTKLYTLLQLDDAFMTIFLPTAQAGRVMIGSEARIVLDALPDTPIPAFVSFVSPEAQFTPKEIETATEREKLMFRIKVKIDPVLVTEHLEKVKSGLPGVAYVRLDDAAVWPAFLQVQTTSGQ